MATGLQIKTSNTLISGGYPNEPVGVDGGWNNWTNTDLSGSVTATYYFYDSDYSDNNRASRIECEIRDSWSASIDDTTNKINITITTTITRLARTQVIGAPNRGFGRRYRAWNADRSSETINVYSADISQITTFAADVQIQQRQFILDPGTENTTGTVYFRGNTGGHDGDGVPSKYVDEMSFGISVKNMLPTPPPKPALTLTSQSTDDCETVNAKIRIDQGRVKDFNVTNTYYRYKIGNGGYTPWILAGTSVSRTTVTLNALPAETEVSVQAYTRGDSTISATSDTLTFTTMARPKHATLSLDSQVAESDETTVAATIAFAQDGVDNFSTLVTRMRYKIGTDGSWSDWSDVGTNQSSGTFVLNNLPDESTPITVETYSLGNGICSSDTGTTVFNTLIPPSRVAINSAVQTDNGSCIDLTYSWTQPDVGLYSTGETYYSVRIGNGAWSEWQLASNWDTGNTLIQCVPYSTRACIRFYSKANGLRGGISQKCVTVSDQTIDDTPYEGDAFINTVLCNSLLYLVELICQEYYAIREGDMEVYTNEETKEQCHGDEDDPTLHSILSRIYRFIGALSCLVCSGLNDDLNVHKRGANGRYLQSHDDGGDYGSWTQPDSTPTEDSTNLVTSGGIHDAIEEYIHSVYHYVGTWDYLTLNETTLNDLVDVSDGAKAIVKNGDGDLNQEYVYDGSTWAAGDLQVLDDFSLVHVINDSSWEYEGQSIAIPAGSGWYWYNNNWNQLDVVTDGEEEAVAEMMGLNYVQQQSEDEEQPHFKVIPRNGDGSVTDPGVVSQRTIYFITEEIQNVTVTFETFGGTEVEPQTIPFGGTIERPESPTLEGFRFAGWSGLGYSADAHFTGFGTQPIYRNITLYADWEFRFFNVRYSASNDTGTGKFSNGSTYLDKPTFYNRLLTYYTQNWTVHPADPTPVLTNKYFAGWLRRTSSTATTADWLDIVYSPLNLNELSPSDGDKMLVEWGSDGRYQLYTYGAVDEEWSAGEVLYWDVPFDRMPDEDCYLMALYRDKYIITFNSAGGSVVDTQYIAPTETVVEPTAPTRTMYRFDGWTADGVEPYDFDSIITGDLTLTAMWTKMHTVTFDTDGGEPVPKPQIVIDGETATQPDDPEKEWYIFNGWIKEEGEE